MVISSRTPEGRPNRCYVCGSDLTIEPSRRIIRVSLSCRVAAPGMMKMGLVRVSMDLEAGVGKRRSVSVHFSTP